MATMVAGNAIGAAITAPPAVARAIPIFRRIRKNRGVGLE
ncbi:hypothetical protein NMS_2118 [Nonlabens marinus S1-08]|uniref:Uncharacterized protein n=1 Tax=Nonlabens marinus S1-08 TaxID=1454201 RepID=W8VXL3_9FLAO|nr:hypothetical protein NMS_2118 [Nonlabens marinus S1-08]